MRPLQTAFKNRLLQQPAAKSKPAAPAKPKITVTPELQQYIDLLHEANRQPKEDKKLKKLIAEKLGLSSL